MLRKDIWKRGVGTTLYGVFIMLLCTTMCLFFVQTIKVQQEFQDTQLAADSIADATAVYASNEGASYEEAVAYATDVQNMVAEKTGTRTTNLVLDREQYEEENKADVKVGLFAKMVDVLFDFNTPEEQIGRQQEMIYEVRAGAATEFTRSALQNFESTLRWLEESIPYATYSNSFRTSTTSDGYIKSADCSSMCYMAYEHMGFTNIGSYAWTTETMANTYFYRIDASELQPGDCIVAKNGSFPGEIYGHAMLYVSEGQCFEMGGQSATRGTDMGYCSMPDLAPDDARLGYHCYRLKPEYMN